MLLVIDKLRDLRWSSLMAVYLQGNLENGKEFYPDLPENQQLMQAEQAFYDYLQKDFFSHEGDLYCIWEENGSYRSALRLERYEDGLLLEALETHPDFRRQGYAQRLMEAVLQQLQPTKLYSHIRQRNIASIAVHEKCGFRKISDVARYVDGSVNTHSGTYLYERQSDAVYKEVL